MAPDAVKLLKPNPAGCEQLVPAMMHGLLVLCGPTVLPAIGPLRVSRRAAEAVPVIANMAAAAAVEIKAPVRAERNVNITIYSSQFENLLLALFAPIGT